MLILSQPATSLQKILNGLSGSVDGQQLGLLVVAPYARKQQYQRRGYPQ